MRIEEGLKLDFKDVLFRPKRSTLKSRSEVSLEVTRRFRNSKAEWTGVPLAAANMDTTGTFEMAIAFAKHKCLVCMHKHYSIEEWTVCARVVAVMLLHDSETKTKQNDRTEIEIEIETETMTKRALG